MLATLPTELCHWPPKMSEVSVHGYLAPGPVVSQHAMVRRMWWKVTVHSMVGMQCLLQAHACGQHTPH